VDEIEVVVRHRDEVSALDADAPAFLERAVRLCAGRLHLPSHARDLAQETHLTLAAGFAHDRAESFSNVRAARQRKRYTDAPEPEAL
jgi:DNA-directed RNA polymerase specialized sigma24 family protein